MFVLLWQCVRYYRCVRLSRDSLPPIWDTKQSPQQPTVAGLEVKKSELNEVLVSQNKTTETVNRGYKPLTCNAWTLDPEV